MVWHFLSFSGESHLRLVGLGVCSFLPGTGLFVMLLYLFDSGK